jgi:hypothetical protein
MVIDKEYIEKLIRQERQLNNIQSGNGQYD